MAAAAAEGVAAAPVWFCSDCNRSDPPPSTMAGGWDMEREWRRLVAAGLMIDTDGASRVLPCDDVDVSDDVDAIEWWWAMSSPPSPIVTLALEVFAAPDAPVGAPYVRRLLRLRRRWDCAALALAEAGNGAGIIPVVCAGEGVSTLLSVTSKLQTEKWPTQESPV